MYRVWTILVFGCALFLTQESRGQLSYDLGISGPSSHTAIEGSAVDLAATYDLTITETGNETATGAQGFQLSLATMGAVLIDRIYVDGTLSDLVANGGIRDPTSFVSADVTTTARPGSPCEGLDGAFLAVVFALIAPVTLEPNISEGVIGRIDVSGAATAPAAGTSETAGTIAHTDGCQGIGQPVDNTVTQAGASVIPNLASVELVVNGIARPSACPFEGNSLQVLIEGAALPDGAENPGLVSVNGVPEGEIGSTEVRATIRSTGLASGLQGWQLSVAVASGDIAITAATTDGTDAADAPVGLRVNGFAQTALTTRFREGSPCDGLEGAMSAVVLSLLMPITLPTDGDNPVLALTVESTVPQPPPNKDGTPGVVSGLLGWRDGCQALGQPVDNVATISGKTVNYDCCQNATVAFNSLVDARQLMLRGDANDDARLDIADPIYTINALFRKGPAPVCMDAADFDNSGLVDVTDATLGIAYQFMGGAPPAPPFPDCGRDGGDEDDDGVLCETETAACSAG